MNWGVTVPLAMPATSAGESGIIGTCLLGETLVDWWPAWGSKLLRLHDDANFEATGVTVGVLGARNVGVAMGATFGADVMGGSMSLEPLGLRLLLRLGRASFVDVADSFKPDLD